MVSELQWQLNLPVLARQWDRWISVALRQCDDEMPMEYMTVTVRSMAEIVPRISPTAESMAGPRARAETCEGRLRGLTLRLAGAASSKDWHSAQTQNRHIGRRNAK